MSVVEMALKRPYTVVAVLILIALMGIGAALRMPVDIFPEIDIPVVAVVWTYNGMSATDIQNRILTLHERQLASLVDDISRIEAVSYQGVGVEKVYLHEGADVTRADLAARQQRAGGAQVHAAQHHAAAGAALWGHRRADHPAQPVEQIACPTPSSTISARTSSARRSRSCTAPRFPIRTAASRASSWPIWIRARCRRADLSPSDVSNALQHQNVILPAGDVKIGDKDYTLAMNNSPDVIETINSFPIKQVGGRTVFMRDVAHVHDGFQVQTNSVSVNGTPGRAHGDPQDRRRVDAGRDRRGARGDEAHRERAAQGRDRSSLCSINPCSSRRRSTACS